MFEGTLKRLLHRGHSCAVSVTKFVDFCRVCRGVSEVVAVVSAKDNRRGGWSWFHKARDRKRPQREREHPADETH